MHVAGGLAQLLVTLSGIVNSGDVKLMDFQEELVVLKKTKVPLAIRFRSSV